MRDALLTVACGTSGVDVASSFDHDGPAPRRGRRVGPQPGPVVRPGRLRPGLLDRDRRLDPYTRL